jgi:hypothetical protein
MIKELESAILTVDLPEYGLKTGDIGTVVLVHRGGEGYEVEFMTLDGDTIAIVTLDADQVKPERGEAVPHARPVSLPRAAGD